MGEKQSEALPGPTFCSAGLQSAISRAGGATDPLATTPTTTSARTESVNSPVQDAPASGGNQDGNSAAWQSGSRERPQPERQQPPGVHDTEDESFISFSPLTVEYAQHANMPVRLDNRPLKAKSIDFCS